MRRKNRERIKNRRNANKTTGPAAEYESEIGGDRTAVSTLEVMGDPSRVENRTGGQTEPQITNQHSTGIGQDMHLEESRRTMTPQDGEQQQATEARESMERRNAMETEEEKEERRRRYVEDNAAILISSNKHSQNANVPQPTVMFEN